MLSEEQGQTLVRLARRQIEERLGIAAQARANPDEFQAPAFGEKRGVFVTLHRNRELRGCIGSLAAIEPLAEGVRRNAVNAAFHDYRFAPLIAAELPELHIEVSVLSEPQPLTATDADDLVRRLGRAWTGSSSRDRTASRPPSCPGLAAAEAAGTLPGPSLPQGRPAR